VLDLRSEDKSSSCPWSEIRDGPEGRGGRGLDGGPVGGGFEFEGGGGGGLIGI